MFWCLIRTAGSVYEVSTCHRYVLMREGRSGWGRMSGWLVEDIYDGVCVVSGRRDACVAVRFCV